MRFVIDSFEIKTTKGKVVLFQLIKQKNGDFRIKKGSSIMSAHSNKSDAVHIFEKMKETYLMMFGYNELFKNEEEESQALDRMREFGGSFVKKLPDLYIHGDPINKRKLRIAFKEYFINYRDWSGV